MKCKKWGKMTISISKACLNQILLWIFFLLQIIDPIRNKFVFQNPKLRKKKRVKEGDKQYSKLNDRMTIKKFIKKKKKKPYLNPTNMKAY